jgi:hypothetical protein
MSSNHPFFEKNLPKFAKSPFQMPKAERERIPHHLLGWDVNHRNLKDSEKDCLASACVFRTDMKRAEFGEKDSGISDPYKDSTDFP